ncbi:MAG: hypothetical protein AAGF31_07670 [Planctomycetota bacterium]
MDRTLAILHLAEQIELTPELRSDLACMAIKLGEDWREVMEEALSELRSIRNVSCADCPKCMSSVVWEETLTPGNN